MSSTAFWKPQSGDRTQRRLTCAIQQVATGMFPELPQESFETSEQCISVGPTIDFIAGQISLAIGLEVEKTMNDPHAAQHHDGVGRQTSIDLVRSSRHRVLRANGSVGPVEPIWRVHFVLIGELLTIPGRSVREVNLDGSLDKEETSIRLRAPARQSCRLPHIVGGPL